MSLWLLIAGWIPVLAWIAMLGTSFTYFVQEDKSSRVGMWFVLALPVIFLGHWQAAGLNVTLLAWAFWLGDNETRLMKQALKLSGAKTKREAVELGLKTLVQLRQQERTRELFGKIHWEGNLDDMRTDK